MTTTVTPAGQSGPEVAPDLADIARSVHEEFDARLEPGVVEETIRQVSARFADARVRSFIPLLVRRYTREALNGRLEAA